MERKEMTETYSASDAYKAVEENPEQQDPTPDVDTEGVNLHRDDGQESTTTGGKSLSELTAKL